MGRTIFIGLLACAAGDICLLSWRSPKLFLAGMACFAIGHIAYSIAFMPFQMGIFPNIQGELSLVHYFQQAVIILGVFAVPFWLIPHLPKNMRLAVPVYLIIILAMVIMSTGLPVERPMVFAMYGAVMFAVSDVFVARDRFVSPTPKNALAITPLYFGAQALFALSTQTGV